MITLAASSLSFRGTHHPVETPTETERPQSTPQGRPINHHVATTSQCSTTQISPGAHGANPTRTHPIGGLDTNQPFR